MIFRLTKNIVYGMSNRLKGPRSFRQKIKTNTFEQKKQIKQDYFKEYYVDTQNLYKNKFNETQLNNTNQMVKRVFSLQNATPSQVLKFRIAEAVKKYQVNLLDHGSSAIQCAAMSQRIILMMQHIKKYPKDKMTARALVKLVQQRRNMLDYLQRTDFHRYKWVCTDYGIAQQAPRNSHHKTDFKLFINPSRGL